MKNSPFAEEIVPDWQGFLACLRREGTPSRVHFIELFLDGEIKEEICRRYGLLDDLDPADPFFLYRKEIAVQRFLGYDYVLCPGVSGESLDARLSIPTLVTADTAALSHSGGRGYIDEHSGPITTWAEFEAYPWPDPAAYDPASLRWYEQNLPADMCLIGGLVGSIYENITFLMGYETLCLALYENRPLVAALAQRLTDLYAAEVEHILRFERVKAIWGSDDLGFRSGTLIAPKDLRELVLPGHRRLAALAHAAGRPYLLHSCGKLDHIYPDLLDDVAIDAKHSYEDTIADVRQLKATLGRRAALLGGIDVDFLCRASQDEIRARVRDVLRVCQPGGGYLLGTGNSVANYIPLDAYLAMLDEGRRFR